MTPTDVPAPESSHWPTREGESYWAELVELFEYKVGDLLAGRTPRGGKRSLGDLREVLLNAPLEGALRRRFGHTDRVWKAHRRQSAPQPAPEPVTAWGSGEASGMQAAGGSEHLLQTELLSLEGLRSAVWRENVRAQARTQAHLWLREAELVTLRCAYALTVNLERGETSMSVPRAGDPLASLSTPSVAERIVLGLADQVCAAFLDPASLLPGARQQALLRLRRAVTELSQNPFPRHPDQDVMDARVQAAEREHLPPDLTRTLIEGIRAEVGPPRTARERLGIREAAERLTAFIESIIPGSEAGFGPELPPLPRALYAATPRFSLSTPDDGNSVLCIRLSGHSMAMWRGLPLRWKRAGEGWLVAIGPLEYRLTSRVRPGHPDPDAAAITVMLGDVSGQALLYTDYLYLVARPNDKGLLELLTLARAVSLLLDPSGAYLNLRLARAAAQRYRDGRIDASSVNVLSAERYGAASPDALLTFARKGVEGLLVRMRQRSAQDNDAVFRAADEAVEAGETRTQAVMKSLRRVLNPATRPESDPGSTPRPVTELGHMRVGGPGELVVLEFTGEPITIEVMARVVTLRLDYKGDLAVILPGAPAALLRELLVLDIAAGGILLVRQGGRIVVSYEPHLR